MKHDLKVAAEAFVLGFVFGGIATMILSLLLT